LINLVLLYSEYLYIFCVEPFVAARPMLEESCDRGSWLNFVKKVMRCSLQQSRRVAKLKSAMVSHISGLAMNIKSHRQTVDLLPITPVADLIIAHRREFKSLTVSCS